MSVAALITCYVRIGIFSPQKSEEGYETLRVSGFSKTRDVRVVYSTVLLIVRTCTKRN